MQVNDDVERILKDTILAYLRYYAFVFLEIPNLINAAVEIRANHVKNRSLWDYRYGNPLLKKKNSVDRYIT